MNRRQNPRRQAAVRFVLWVALVCGLLVSGSATEADSLIIPVEYADREGPVAFGSSVSPGITPRFHFLYYGFEFPAGPIDITGFRLRPKAYTGNVTLETRGLQVSLTTTREMSLQASFQSNLDNALQAPTLLIDGDVLTETTRQQPPLNPKDFDYEYTWETTPFRYDPADGLNLLLDFNVTGGAYGSPAWDAASNGNFLHEGERLHRSAVNSKVDTRFPITQILYTPVHEGPGPFLRGDCNADGKVDVSDAVCMLNWLFVGDGAPGCVAATNMNGDDAANISDATYLLSYLFGGGGAPVAPFPDCGPGAVPADEELGCANSPNCQ